MNKKKAGAVFAVLLTCGLTAQAFAQGQEPKFNSNADDITKIGNLLEEFRQDIIRKDGNALKKLMLHPNVVFHSIDNQESVDNARKLNAQFDGIGPSALDGFVTLLATSKDKLEERFQDVEIRQDGDLGLVTFNYEFVINDKIHHSGLEHWQVRKIDGQWKILSVTWTKYTVTTDLRRGNPQPSEAATFRDCSNGCPEMVVVPEGKFTMGASAGEEGNLPEPYSGHSVPQHLVAIRHRFAIGKFDVTRDEYAQFVAETHRPDPDSCTTVEASGNGFIVTNGNWHSTGFPQTGKDPVVCVSWDDAQAYVAWLSAKTGHVYRFPTEAEWEYAARAGTTTARYFSDNPAEFCRHTNVGDLDYGEQHPSDSGVLACRDGYAFTSPVGSFPPNQFGLYDMLGDVMNMTEDCWNANYSGAPIDGAAWLTGECSRRVVHGGSWDMDIRAVRSAMRRALPTSNRNTTLGFRVARTL